MLSERATVAPRGEIASRGETAGEALRARPGREPRLDTPVAMVVFNRPDLSARVFEAVRAARPKQLMLVADGPREGRPGEDELCAATRAAISNVDWDCEVLTKFEERNLGCGPAVASGISWVFEHVERAIILEDDCLPDPTFFPFCTELLERYADDRRVMQIAGSNWRAPETAFGDDSYAFASFPVVWGWATWRRAWAKYDRAMPTWPEFRDRGMVAGLPMSRRWQRHATREWDYMHAGNGTWDHQWQYCVLSEHGLSAYPRRNLVSNLGFRADATQTFEAGDLAEVPMVPLDFPLRHPAIVAENAAVEAHLGRQILMSTGKSVQLFRRLVPSHRARRAVKRLVFRGS